MNKTVTPKKDDGFIPSPGLTPEFLEHAGIELVRKGTADKPTIELRCMECNRTWETPLDVFGRLSRSGWWNCPYRYSEPWNHK